MDKILKLLEENARYTNEEIAVMTQKTPEEVAETIDRLEKEASSAAINRLLTVTKFPTAAYSP